MGEHKNPAVAAAREAAAAPPTERDVLIGYLRNIFPNVPDAHVAKVADHQIEWLKRNGYRIVPLDA